MPLSGFHPVTQQWFTQTLGNPTPAQAQGWAAIREKRHTLIAAPTGSGKTLAAFLTALDELFQEGLTQPLRDEVRVVYVSPLKALSTDIHKNLAEPRLGLRKLAEEMGIDAPRITAAVRTGDTEDAGELAGPVEAGFAEGDVAGGTRLFGVANRFVVSAHRRKHQRKPVMSGRIAGVQFDRAF